MRRIVVVGGGFAGLRAVTKIEEGIESRRKVSVTLISEQASFLATPLLGEVAVGRVKLPSISVPLKRVCRRETRIVTDRIVAVDVQNRSLVGQRGHYDFDYLIVATGSRSDWGANPDWRHSATALKTGRDAVDIREMVVDAFEAASRERDRRRRQQLMTFVVVGAGRSGTHLVGQLASTLQQGSAKAGLPPARLELIEAADTVLPGEEEAVQAERRAALEQAGVVPLLGHRVSELGGGALIAGTETILTNNVIWCGGVKADDLGVASGLPVDAAGSLQVDRHLRCVGHAGIYAVGDVAFVEGAGPSWLTSTRADSQAQVAAHNVLADLAGRSPSSWSGLGESPPLRLGDPGYAPLGGRRLGGRLGSALNELAAAWEIPSPWRRASFLKDRLG